MHRIIQLLRPPKLCFLLARLTWSLLALAVPLAVMACGGMMPAAFLFWSFLALPLALITIIWTHRSGVATPRRSCFWGFAIWLLLLAGFGVMVLAGDSIHWSSWLHWTIQIIYGVAMIGVVIAAFFHLWRADHNAAIRCSANRPPITDGSSSPVAGDPPPETSPHP